MMRQIRQHDKIVQSSPRRYYEKPWNLPKDRTKCSFPCAISYFLQSPEYEEYTIHLLHNCRKEGCEEIEFKDPLLVFSSIKVLSVSKKLFKGVMENKCEMIVKEFELSRENLKMIRKLEKLEHYGLIHFFDSFRYNKSAFVCVECMHQSLENAIKKKEKFTEIRIASFMKQLTDTLLYLYDNEITLHGNINLANTFLGKYTKFSLKLTNFINDISDPQKRKVLLENEDLRYYPPEVLSDEFLDEKVDVWSLGILALQLAEPHNSFFDKNTNSYDKEEMIKQWSKPIRLEGMAWSPEFYEFIEACLQVDAFERPSMKQLQKFKFLRKA